jgi:hypothetical protein
MSECGAVALWRKGDKNFRCRVGPVGPRFPGFAGRGSGREVVAAGSDQGFKVSRGEGQAAHCRASALANPGSAVAC